MLYYSYYHILIRQTKLASRNHTSVLVGILHAKLKKCAKSIMDTSYISIFFIMPTNHFPLVLYKGTYLILLKRICTSFITEDIGSYLFSVLCYYTEQLNGNSLIRTNLQQNTIAYYIVGMYNNERTTIQ